ncbi:MAG: SAM-dependent methyltransferase [bacterium]
MSEELAEIIREEIRARGPMPLYRWMWLCLYHPQHGYYTKPRPDGQRITGPGRDADFVTPPTLHPFFGEAIAKELAGMWQQDGRPAVFRVLEYGGGEGGLARAALAWADQADPGFAAAVAWHHAEISPSHQAAILHEKDSRVKLQPTQLWGAHHQPAGLPWPYDAVLACEYVDALPVDVLEAVDNGAWRQVAVESNASGFAEVLIEPRGLPLPERGAPGERRLVESEVQYWVEDAVEPGRTRHMLVVDYGARGMPADLRGFRSHAAASFLDRPGDTDITRSVDFEALRFEVECNPEPNGLVETSFETLESFLLRHGVLDELNAIDRSTPGGASSYLRLRQLLLPTGLGAAFKVQRFDRIPAKQD